MRLLPSRKKILWFHPSGWTLAIVVVVRYIHVSSSSSLAACAIPSAFFSYRSLVRSLPACLMCVRFLILSPSDGNDDLAPRSDGDANGNKIVPAAISLSLCSGGASHKSDGQSNCAWRLCRKPIYYFSCENSFSAFSDSCGWENKNRLMMLQAVKVELSAPSTPSNPSASAHKMMSCEASSLSIFMSSLVLCLVLHQCSDRKKNFFSPFIGDAEDEKKNVNERETFMLQIDDDVLVMSLPRKIS